MVRRAAVHAGARVAEKTGAREPRLHQRAWVPEASIELGLGGERDRLEAGGDPTRHRARHRARHARAVTPEYSARNRPLVAEDASGIVGTVQLVLAQPDNQAHRADVPTCRRCSCTDAPGATGSVQR